MIAAGGGGDAITSAVLGPFLGLTDERPVVLTYAWDRLLVDPVAGPRAAGDFTGLRELAPDVLEVVPTTSPVPPAGSTLPRLATELPARLLLLDPTRGAAGLAGQVAAAARYFGADRLALVDVGGDALTDGKDEGLRSPLADLLTVAACSLLDLQAELLVPGPGIDGELPEAVVLERVRELGGRTAATLDTASVESVRAVFRWHPSEASGLITAAARGARGLVETRDAGCPVRLGDRSTSVLAIDLGAVVHGGPAFEVRTTTSLDEARARMVEITGVDEIGYEIRKAETLERVASSRPGATELDRIDSYAAAAAARGAEYLSFRRLAELLNVRSAAHLAELRRLLEQSRSARYDPPVYRV
jgi:hypothetical protein